MAAIDKQLSGFFDRTDLIIASVTLPQFKLRWLDDTGKEQARSLLHSFASALHDSSPDTGPDGNVSLEDNFFCFVTSGADKRGANAEVDMCVTDTSKELRTLAKFPIILKIFLKHNTTLPSSAPVERHFSVGSQIYLPRRNRLTDDHFERQLF